MPSKSAPEWASHEPAEHPVWLHATRPGLGDPRRWKHHYELTAHSAVHELEASQAWRAVLDHLRGLQERHDANFAERLILAPPKFVIKPFESACEKAYRYNVVKRDAPPPTDEIVGPHNWYERLGDIVRSTVVVLTMDTIQPVCAGVVQALEAHGVDASWEPRSELRGYHAAHVSFRWNCKVSSDGQSPADGCINVEIQVKTYLQDTLSRLTHERYRTKRISPDAMSDVAWAWQPDSPEFHSNLLGHVAQYLDGAISNLRKRDEQ